MPPEKGALDEFAEDFKVEKHEVDPFEIPKKDEEEIPEKEEVEEDKDAPRKNRQHRRLESKLQAEREANIALTERVKVLSETQQFRKDTDSPLSTDISRIYGIDTPEAREATRILQGALEQTRKEAQEAALKSFNELQEGERKAQRDAEALIDTELEALEDEFDVDLTSDSPAARKARREFLDVVAKLSPKDAEGNIKDYADFSEAFEIFQSRKEKADSSRTKDLASRSMVKSGSAPTKNLEQQTQEQYLREMGII